MAMNMDQISIPANTVTLVAGNVRQLTVTNTSTTSTIYLGEYGVSTTAYGVALAPGASVHIGDLPVNFYGYATSAAVLSILYIL